MKLYGPLAHLYPLLSPREDYVEEAAVIGPLLRAAAATERPRLLELGCGPGHLASHLDGFALTLSDLSPELLAMAQRNNPGARCVVGDMRSLRLTERFDLAFIHDAICYMRDEQALTEAIQTAFVHLKPGGVALLIPDYVAENFEPGRECAGGSAGGEHLSYLAEHWLRPGERDHYVVDYILAHRVGEAAPTLHHERHEEGLFSTETWLRAMRAAGFEAWTQDSPGDTAPIFFWGRRPAEGE